MARPPFIFNEEKRNTAFYHNIKIFISGADVTPWLTSQVIIQRSGRKGIGTCTFSLSNVFSAFELTRANLNIQETANKDDEDNFVTRDSNGRVRTKGIFRMSDPYSAEGRYSELAKFSIFEYKTRPEVNIKHSVKAFGPVKNTTRGGRVTTSGLTQDESAADNAVTYRYPMNVGSLVFHRFDPVRVFVQNPFTSSDDEWSLEFTGYLDTKPFSQDYVNGMSVINISCQDIRVYMQNMRTGTNPAAVIGNDNFAFFTGTGEAVADEPTAGAFNDQVSPFNRITHVLGGQTFEQSIKTLLFGFDQDGSTKGGVGQLSEGERVEYDPGSDGRARVLEEWNNTVQFGTNIKDPATGRTSGYFTKAGMLKLGADTVIGGAGSPDAQKVHFLFPAEGAPLTNLIAFSQVDQRIDARVEFATRLELLVNLCNSLDYEFYVNGSGDVIFEFPMYDFLPADYEQIWQNILTFQYHAIRDSINDEGGTPITALEITSEFINKEISEGNAEAAGQAPGTAPASELRRTIYSNVLASRIGVHVETHHVPGVRNQSRLAQLGLIEFNKRLSNYDQFSLETSFRPYIGVNRPIYHQIKERMGITQTVTYSYQIRGEVSVSMDLSYTRKLQGNSFRFITGGERSPISYNTIFSGPGVLGSGVRSSGTEANSQEGGGASDPKAAQRNQK